MQASRAAASPEGMAIATLSGHRDGVNALAFSPPPHDGVLASASNDTTIKLWNARGRTLLSTLHGHTGNVNSVSFSPDGATLGHREQATERRA